MHELPGDVKLDLSGLDPEVASAIQKMAALTGRSFEEQCHVSLKISLTTCGYGYLGLDINGNLPGGIVVPFFKDRQDLTLD